MLDIFLDKLKDIPWIKCSVVAALLLTLWYYARMWIRHFFQPQSLKIGAGLQIVEVMPLDNHHRVYVIRKGEHTFLVLTGPHNSHILPLVEETKGEKEGKRALEPYEMGI